MSGPLELIWVRDGLPEDYLSRIRDGDRRVVLLHDLGAAVVDGGAPAGMSKTVSASEVTDGGGAMVVVRADRAKDMPNAPVYVLGHATAHWHRYISQMEDLTVTAATESGIPSPAGD